MFLIDLPSFCLKELGIEIETLPVVRRREGIARCRFWRKKDFVRMIEVKSGLTATSSQASRSIRQEFSDLRIDAAREVHRAGLSGRFSISCGSPDANHCAIACLML